jgi:DNA mismatch repair protein MutS
MNETAYILHTATEKSLVIMDEVGRGTGTEDGLSIAWAVCEELLNNIKCRTLFATHFHELSRIDNPGMANRSMDVAEQDGEIIFLRKLREGPAANSYGLHVAALAGLPQSVLRRAGEIMTLLASNKVRSPALPAGYTGIVPPKNNTENKVLESLSELEADKLSPLEALNLIHRWKKLIKSRDKRQENRTRNNGAETGGRDLSLFD